jgi:predicted negative regulator of RcsB-dependent stress response
MPDGKEKTKAIADYRRMMGLSYANLSELELAYLEEDEEKVDEAMKKVKAGKKEGHKKYSDD